MTSHPAPQSEIVLYQTEDGRTRVACRLGDENLWLTQKLMAELFQKDVRTINEHVQNILAEGELEADSVVRKFRITAADGKSYDTQHYGLPMILAVGYRVRSARGTLFRQWATERLSEYLVKGFTMDDERLKNPGPGIPDYFDELLERIRDIRASERRMYLRVKDIFALAGDYDPSREETRRAFQIIQNKLHFAVTGKTSAELIAGRADAGQPNMGLTNWHGDAVRKRDVAVAKNYLSEDEITELNRIVVMFLDYAEDQASRRKQVFLSDWQVKLDEFLRFNDRAVLTHAGKVSHDAASGRAGREYDDFSARRRAAAEAQGERELRELERVAKELPKPKAKPRPTTKRRKKTDPGDKP